MSLTRLDRGNSFLLLMFWAGTLFTIADKIFWAFYL